jgi:hypothetical protein
MSTLRLSSLAAVILVAAQLATSPALAQAPQMSVKKPAAQVTATVAENRNQAATNPAKFDCQGPFTFSFTRVVGAGAPMVYDFSIEFTGAANARDMGPGKCWRSRGWEFGPALSASRKGVLIYRVDMGKCPFLESVTFENGKITKFKANDRYMGSTWFDQAVRGSGTFAVEATFIGTTSTSVPVPYSVTVAPDVATRVATCTP